MFNVIANENNFSVEVNGNSIFASTNPYKANEFAQLCEKLEIESLQNGIDSELAKELSSKLELIELSTNKGYITYTLEHISQLASDLELLEDVLYVENTKNILRKMYKSILTSLKVGANEASLKCRELQDTIVFYEFDINSQVAGV